MKTLLNTLTISKNHKVQIDLFALYDLSPENYTHCIIFPTGDCSSITFQNGVKDPYIDNLERSFNFNQPYEFKVDSSFPLYLNIKDNHTAECQFEIAAFDEMDIKYWANRSRNHNESLIVSSEGNIYGYTNQEELKMITTNHKIQISQSKNSESMPVNIIAIALHLELVFSSSFTGNVPTHRGTVTFLNRNSQLS